MDTSVIDFVAWVRTLGDYGVPTLFVMGLLWLIRRGGGLFWIWGFSDDGYITSVIKEHIGMMRSNKESLMALNTQLKLLADGQNDIGDGHEKTHKCMWHLMEVLEILAKHEDLDVAEVRNKMYEALRERVR